MKLCDGSIQSAVLKVRGWPWWSVILAVEEGQPIRKVGRVSSVGTRVSRVFVLVYIGDGREI